MTALVQLRQRQSYKGRREFSNSCATCTTLQTSTRCSLACCRVFLVSLSQEDRDAGLETLAPFVDLLAKKPNGSCEYLDEDTHLCRVWDERPLECRTYDCREDSRGRTAFLAVQMQAFISAPGIQTCPSCASPLALLGGRRAAWGDFALCATCYAPFEFRFRYSDAVFSLAPAVDVMGDDKARYALRAKMYQENFDGALDDLSAVEQHRDLDEEELRIRSMALCELGRFDDAVVALERCEDSADKALEMAILEIRRGRLDDALTLMHGDAMLLPAARQPMRHLYVGRAKVLAGDFESAATAFGQGLLLAFANEQGLTVHKEKLLEMEAAGGAEAVAATLVLDRLAPIIKTLRD